MNKQFQLYLLTAAMVSTQSFAQTDKQVIDLSKRVRRDKPITALTKMESVVQVTTSKHERYKGDLIAYHYREVGGKPSNLLLTINKNSELYTKLKPGMWVKVSYVESPNQSNAEATPIEVIEPKCYLRENFANADENPGCIGMEVLVEGLSTPILTKLIYSPEKNIIEPPTKEFVASIYGKMARMQGQKKINFDLYKEQIHEAYAVMCKFVYSVLEDQACFAEEVLNSVSELLETNVAMEDDDCSTSEDLVLNIIGRIGLFGEIPADAEDFAKDYIEKVGLKFYDNESDEFVYASEEVEEATE
jgi:hypothetical protein